MQDLDINPYTLDPYSAQTLTTDLKVLYPNFQKTLYQTQGGAPSCSKSVGSKSKASQDHDGKGKASSQKQEAPPLIDYECQRKYCSYCIRTNYEDHFAEIQKNKAWHCYHCTGYCMCTRCSRQDILT